MKKQTNKETIMLQKNSTHNNTMATWQNDG